MSSRAEQKEARRREREAQEQAAAKSAANKRRLQIVAGAVLGLALIGAIIAVAVGGGGGGSDTKKDPGDTTEAKAPSANISDFDEAVKTSGCVYKAVPPTGGGEHTSEPVTYKQNPPSSGAHHPEAAPAGIYEPGNEPDKEKWVHSLEHGRILMTYKPGTPPETVKALEGVFNEPLLGTPGYQKQVLQNNTKMPFAIAALAWGQQLTCKEVKNAPATYDAIRAFATRFANKAPEEIP